MAYDVTTKPGSWVRSQHLGRERRIAAGLALGFGLLGVSVLALTISDRAAFYASGVVAALFLLVHRYADRYIETHGRFYDGVLAEEEVGATLEELRRKGWIVMHDFLFGGEGNVDHLVCGPNGVFLIETKARRFDKAHLARARRQAARLHDELGVWVTPVVCLHVRRKAAFKFEHVWIVPHRELLDWLRSQHNKPVEFERLARFADRL